MVEKIGTWDGVPGSPPGFRVKPMEIQADLLYEVWLNKYKDKLEKHT